MEEMSISTALLSIIITCIVLLVGLGIWAGRLSEKLNGAWKAINQMRAENNAEHLEIGRKIDIMISHNGYSNKK